jgi:hypothetical protein
LLDAIIYCWTGSVKFLGVCWRWLSQSENQKILALIGTAAAAVVSGIWQVYLHISKKSKDTPTVSHRAVVSPQVLQQLAPEEKTPPR